MIDSEVMGAAIVFTSVGSSTCLAAFFFDFSFAFSFALSLELFFGGLISPFCNLGFVFSCSLEDVTPNLDFLFSLKVQIKHSVSPLIFSIFPPSQAA